MLKQIFINNEFDIIVNRKSVKSDRLTGKEVKIKVLITWEHIILNN